MDGLINQSPGYKVLVRTGAVLLGMIPIRRIRLN